MLKTNVLYVVAVCLFTLISGADALPKYVCWDKTGQGFLVNENVPTGDSCEICHCSNSGDIQCAMQSCAKPPCDNSFVPKGGCCPICKDGCVYNGVKYEVGTVFPDDCNNCTCQQNGLVSCTEKFCGDTCNNGKRPLPSTICGGIAALKCPDYFICEDSSVLKGGADLSGLCCPDCQTVRCGAPSCKNPYTPDGQCCPVCPDCSNAICLAIKCPYDIWIPGACCPICGQDCSLVLCPQIRCAHGSIKEPGKCCEECKPATCTHGGQTYNAGDSFKDDCNTCHCTDNGLAICTMIACTIEKCENGLMPIEEKCGGFQGLQCPKAYKCDYSNVPENSADFFGICCKDCSNVKCAEPSCPNYFTPEGQCCPVCPAIEKCENGLIPIKEKCGGFQGLQCPKGHKCDYSNVPENSADFFGICCKDCSNVKCAEPSCSNYYTPAGQCCPICPGCRDENGNFYKTGADVPGTNPCRSPCTCTENGDIICAIVDCFFDPDCENPVYEEGRCCPVCQKVDKCENGLEPITDKCGGKIGLLCPKGYMCDYSNAPPGSADFLGMCCQINVCELPTDSGPCEALIQRYFFNNISGQCEQFNYGGCKGNGNNFESLKACQSSCAEVCEQPKKPGTCKGSFNRYFYNSITKTCELFIYGGCEGNHNNFETQEECQATCSNVCNLPKEPGPCKAYFPRYFFNTETQSCDKFIYGGCKGNNNNFVTLEDCQSACSVCDLPKDPGPCRASIPRYFYDSETETCGKFTYGGCKGNSNNFETLEDCWSTCNLKGCTDENGTVHEFGAHVPSTDPCRTPCICTGSGKIICAEVDCVDPGCKKPIYEKGKCCPVCPKYVCELPKISGPCEALIQRYFFNKISGQCEQFNYGGCKGNGNNFESLKACQSSCAEVCEQPKKPGPCKGSFNRYFYNSIIKTCELFIYGGCEGNHNNFETQEECQATCFNDCELPKEPGPCKAYFPRYFYNSDTQSCDKFIYGGCKGNKNNFGTLEDCQSACSVCDLPKDPGPCRASIPRYFYDSETETCGKFTYGGCKGNSNNFGTLEDCWSTCNLKGCTDENGTVHEFGAHVPSTDPCRTPCMCTGSGQIICAEVDCVDPGCKKPIYKKGKCCPVCPKFCKHSDGKKYKIGLRVPANDACKKCKCQEGGEVVCEVINCKPTSCKNPKTRPGKCCPRCPKFCKHTNGKKYKIGVKVPNKDPCKTCTCEEGGDVICATTSCEKPKCDRPITRLGKCCPECPKSKKRCRLKNGKRYRIGCKVPCPDPCKSCRCAEGAHVLCVTTKCDVPCDDPVKVPGKCCPTCPTVCKHTDGITYKPGETVPTENQCTESCVCTDEGKVKCSELAFSCLMPLCNNAKSVKEQCCPICPEIACYQTMKPGSCKGSFTRYFYNRETKKCESFIYGGCNGSQNRFKTLQECRDTCVRR